VRNLNLAARDSRRQYILLKVKTVDVVVDVVFWMVNFVLDKVNIKL
jgi:hypothetical protein